MNNKYKMFKNFMYNELGLSKGDVKRWVKEAIKEVAENYVKNQLSPNLIEDEAKKAVDSFYNGGRWESSLRDKIAKGLAERMEVKFIKEQEQK